MYYTSKDNINTNNNKFQRPLTNYRNDNENLSYNKSNQSHLNNYNSSQGNYSPDNAPRVSEVLPDVIHYPGVYPVFNPFSFYPWFAHYWDLYEREFEDLVERREKYELFKDLLRQEEHEYLHINKPKEKYRAVNHLLGTHKMVVNGIDDYHYNRNPNYSYIVKHKDKDKDINRLLKSDMQKPSTGGNREDVFIYGTSQNNRSNYKFKNQDFKWDNSSSYYKELNFGNKMGKSLDNLKSKEILTPMLDKYMNYETFKRNNDFSKKKDPPYYSNDHRDYESNQNNRYY